MGAGRVFGARSGFVSTQLQPASHSLLPPPDPPTFIDGEGVQHFCWVYTHACHTVRSASEGGVMRRGGWVVLAIAGSEALWLKHGRCVGHSVAAG